MKETIVKINKNKSLFFEKINKIDREIKNFSDKQKLTQFSTTKPTL